MAKPKDFLLVIEVDGYGYGVKEPVTTNISINFPNPCKNSCQQWMIRRVVDRTRMGLDVDFQPFAPKVDGSPTNLTKTGAMLGNVKAARGSDLRARGALAAVGISCYLTGRETYPWILHNGINEENYKKKRTAVVDRMIARKQARLQRKTEAIAKTSEVTMKWEYLMDLKAGIEIDITELQKRRAEIESTEVAAMPPRQWWGLSDDDQDRVESALQEWVSAVVASFVKNACNPRENDRTALEKEADQAFLNKFRD